MLDNFMASPLKAYLLGAAIGAMYCSWVELPPVADVPLWTTVIGDVITGALFASAYYFLLRTLVSDVKQEVHLRTMFARFFFIWMGGTLGVAVILIARGYPSFEAISSFLTTVVFAAIAYRKLFKLYRAANEKGGSYPPKTD